MLFKNRCSSLLLASFCFLGLGCSSVPPDHNSAGAGLQNTPVSKATSEEHLGMDYLLGRGVAENDEQAFEWFHKSAEAGSPTAANELAYLYASGKGVLQDYQLAFHWYEQAAAAGIPSAEYNLGLFYAYGLGTPIDPAKASTYFERAAAQGFAPAQKRLSV